MKWLPHFLSCCLTVSALAQAPVTEEIATGFLPHEWINAAVRKSLSPQGRASLVTASGPIRVTDLPERVEAARRSIVALQAAPALVPIEITFATMARRVVQRLPADPPVVDRGIPVPERYDPPRIIAGAGGVTVVPAHPRQFTTRSVGSGPAVVPPAIGYQTSGSEVRLRETQTVASGARKFAISAVLGRETSVPILRRAQDLAGLHALAIQRGAVTDAEPAWTTAATELAVTAEASGAAVVVKVVPVITFPPAGPGLLPRRIPINECAAAIMVAPGATSQTGILPKTDPEFYRVFLGAPPPAAEESFTAMTLSANVQYLGSPPPSP